MTCRRLPEQTLLWVPGKGARIKQEIDLILFTNEGVELHRGPREYGPRACCSEASQLYTEGMAGVEGQTQASSARAPPGLLFPEGGCLSTATWSSRCFLMQQGSIDSLLCASHHPKWGQQNDTDKNPCLPGAPIQTCEGTDNGHKLM